MGKVSYTMVAHTMAIPAALLMLNGAVMVLAYNPDPSIKLLRAFFPELYRTFPLGGILSLTTSILILLIEYCFPNLPTFLKFLVTLASSLFGFTHFLTIVGSQCMFIVSLCYFIGMCRCEGDGGRGESDIEMGKK